MVKAWNVSNEGFFLVISHKVFKLRSSFSVNMSFKSVFKVQSVFGVFTVFFVFSEVDFSAVQGLWVSSVSLDVYSVVEGFFQESIQLSCSDFDSGLHEDSD